MFRTFHFKRKSEAKLKASVVWVLCVLIVFCMQVQSKDTITEGFDTENCTFNGKTLHGKVKVVEHFADIKVQVVTSFPDLKVKVVEHFPDSCGEWQMVEHFPDFTIQFVTSFPDIKIKYVEHFPGINK